MLSSIILSLAVASSVHSPAAIKDYTISRAMAHGVSPTLAVSIIEAESNFNIDAKNKGSTASGLAQYLNGTFKAFCIDKYSLTTDMANKNNPYVQIECLTLMLADGGEHHWDASRSIWKKKLAGES